jgi:uncharacterized protein with HEPN domain
MRRDDGYLLDILSAARRVLEYARGIDEAGFLASAKDQDAILRQLTIIGEAARRVSDECRAKHPEIPWSEMTGMRNRLVHDYLNVKLGTIWQTIQQDIPALISLIEPLVPPEQP